jgi:hypothetical protein
MTVKAERTSLNPASTLTQAMAAGILVITSSCAVTPQPVFGAPLESGEVAPGLAWGVSYGPGTATVSSDGESREGTGNGDSVIGGAALDASNVVPQFAAVRASVLPRLDIGAHGGWYGAGSGARLRLTPLEAPDALFATLDAQLGYAAPRAARTALLPRPYAVRLGTEGTLALRPNTHLLGMLGLSYGNRRHGVDAPSVVSAADGIGFEQTLAVQRQELRLETGLGLSFRMRHFGIQTMFVPYVVLEHGPAQAECIACDASVTLGSFRQAWGFSLVFNPFAVFDID